MSSTRPLRRRPLLLVPVLALLLAGAGVQPAPGQELAVTGRVVDPEGRPLAGTVVTLHAPASRLERGALRLAGETFPAPAARGRADADGRFHLVAPEPGLWTVLARLPGRVPVARALHPLHVPADLEPAVLLPDAHLTVQVVDEAGEPLAGVPVAFRGRGLTERMPSWRPGSWEVRRTRVAVTGPRGRAALPRLQGEEGSLFAAAPAGTASVELSGSGGTAPRRLVLRPRPTRVVRALAPSGRPVAGALVWARDPIPAGVTDEDGTLAVPLAGSEAVRVHLDAPGGRVAHAVLEPPAENESGPEDVVLGPVPEVAGRVVQAGTGRGIADALVWPEDEPEAAARSGRGGGFRVPVLHGPGGAVLKAAAPGHLGGEWADSESRGRAAQPVVLELEPAVHLTGRVVDGEGRPLPGVSIQAVALGPGGYGSRSGVAPGRARSGSDGRFRIDPLPAGEVLSVRASRDGYAPWRERVTPVTSAAGAAPVRFPELEVVLSAGATVRGRLVDEAGSPVAGAEVTLSPSTPRFDPWTPEPEELRTESGPDGVFELHELPAGRAELEVTAVGRAPLRRPGLEIPSRPEVRDLGDLVLEPEAVLEGVVEDPRGAPVVGAEVRTASGDGIGYSHFPPAGGQDDPPLATGSDGSFRVDGLRPGDTVDVWVSKEGYAQGVLRGVRLPPEDTVTVVLEPSASVSGRVVDEAGRGVPEVRVSASREAGFWKGVSQAGLTEEDGSFLARVSPGIVRLQAGGGMEHLPSAPLTLDLAPGERREGVELVVRPAAEVRGRVFAADGSPVPGAAVSVTTRDGRSSSRFGTAADADGRFEVHARPGRVRLTASKEGHTAATRDLELAPEGAAVELRLGRGTEVSGRVVGPDGERAPGRRLLLAGGGSNRQAVSAGDGSFRFRNVADGTFQLLVRGNESGGWNPGHAYTHPEEVVVSGGVPVEGILVRLDRRVTLRGRLLGLAPEELTRATVGAHGGPRGFQRVAGTVLFGGAYEIEGLAPGRWTVSAAVKGSGRSGSGNVEIAPGEAEAYLDLELREGLTVTGTVLWNGEPAAGVQVSGVRVLMASAGRAVTDADGRFRLAGLAPGRQQIAITAPDWGLWTSRIVEVHGGEDLLLEIDTARVRGTVLSAAGMEPVAEAAVSLELRQEVEKGFRSGRPTTTGADGTFLFQGVEPGVYDLRVSKAGYGAHVTLAEVAEGGETALPPVVLEPVAALELRVRTADGAAPEQVGVTALGPDGTTFLDTWLVSSGGGRFVLESLPPGSWELLVYGGEWAPARVRAVSPGPPVDVVLRQGSVLEVSVPALAGSGAVAHVQVADGAGRRPALFDRLPGGVPFAGGAVRVPTLPPGTWQVTVTAADGRAWSATVHLAAGATEQVELR